MRIKEWEREDQPYEKLLIHGASKLTDVELLAIFLKTGIYGKSALDIAKELLFEYGSLQEILSSPKAKLTAKPGIGKIKYLTLQAAVELGKRYVQPNFKKQKRINTIKKAKDFLTFKMQSHLNEVFACLLLKTNLELIRFEELFFGTINETNIYPREIVRKCLDYNAAKVILAHNHPSGSTTPSAADRAATELICQALKLIDVEVVDHIIIGSEQTFSFKDAGLL